MTRFSENTILSHIFCALLIGLLCSIMAMVYSDSVQADLADNLVRLHIIANSDSDADQAVKLAVRDRIIEEEKQNFAAASEKEDCREKIKNNLSHFEEIANEVLKEKGFSYKAHAEYGVFDFPMKRYEGMVLPAGGYEGMRLVLGSGSGQNWWCVMFPPLCFTEGSTGGLDAEGEQQLKDSLEGESYDVITGQEIVVKFKVVEVVQELKQKFE